MQTDFIMRLEFFKCEPKFLKLLEEPRTKDWELKTYNLLPGRTRLDELCFYFKGYREFGNIDAFSFHEAPNCEDVIIFSYSADDSLQWLINEHGVFDTMGIKTLLQLSERTKDLFEAVPAREEKLRSILLYTHWECIFREEYEEAIFKGIIDMSELKYI